MEKDGKGTDTVVPRPPFKRPPPNAMGATLYDYPLPASNRTMQRPCLNCGGNRQANSALHDLDAHRPEPEPRSSNVSQDEGLVTRRSSNGLAVQASGTRSRVTIGGRDGPRHASDKALDRDLSDTDPGLLFDARPDLNGVESRPDQRGACLLLLGRPAVALTGT